LIDGGILDPVPVALARMLAPGLPVVAVVLSPPVTEWIKPTPPRLLDSLPFLSSYLSRNRLAQALNIFMRSIDIAGAELTELRLQVDQPEVILRPAVPHIGLMDTVKIPEVIGLGEAAVESSLQELNRSVSWRGWISRQITFRRRKQTILGWEKDCSDGT
jgi:NTE family protein